MLFQDCVRAHKERLSMDIVPHIQCSVTGQEYNISCIVTQHYHMINDLPFLRQRQCREPCSDGEPILHAMTAKTLLISRHIGDGLVNLLRF